MRKLWSAVLTAAFALSVGVVAPAMAAGERDDLADKLQQNKERIDNLEAQLEGVDVNIQKTYLDLESTRAQIPIAVEALAIAEQQMAAAEQQQKTIADRLAVAENEQAVLAGEIQASRDKIDGAQDALGALARATYQNGGVASQNPVAMLFGSQSTDDFLTQYTAMDSAVRSQTQVLNDMSELEASLENAQLRSKSVLVRIEELKVEADAAVAAADTARDAAAAKRSELANLEAAQITLAASLETQKDQIEAQRAALERDNAALASRIAAIDAANRKNNGGVAVPSGKLIPPVPSPVYVTSPYGYRVYPITGGWWMHYGVDLRSACGNKQWAVANGVVSEVRPAYGNGTHGNQVIINHGMIDGASYVSVYNHLSTFAAKAGQAVSQGQTIGYTGATGAVTGCHVHLEIWKNGKTIDPMSLPAF